ncbi:MAG TPA: hypothetical protein VE592_11360, partial [Geminicoccaceae bacterium]|nr:hypothetical protein [Geminicoccaceae bacterium]
MEFRSVPGRQAVGSLSARAAGRGRRLVDWAVALARQAAERPLSALAAILAANLVLIGLFVAAGELVFADPAEFFRELMPGTWLSVA